MCTSSAHELNHSNGSENVSGSDVFDTQDQVILSHLENLQKKIGTPIDTDWKRELPIS